MSAKPLTQYVLPDLPYDEDALEPHISAEIVKLHHDEHHRAYVDKANEVAAKIARIAKSDDFEELAALEHQLAFNVSGHLLHSVYWQNLSPKGGDEPDGLLAEAIARDFGSFDTFKHQLTSAAATVSGSGWGALIWDPIVCRLTTVQIHDHESSMIQGGVPIMVLDAWEHAYYLQYRNRRPEYCHAIWNLWNWDDISRRLQDAQKFTLSLDGDATPQDAYV